MVLALAEEALALPLVSWDKAHNKLYKASRDLAKTLEAWAESLAVALEGVSEETLGHAWVLVLEVSVEEEPEEVLMETAQEDLWGASLAEVVSQVLDDPSSQAGPEGLPMLV